VRARPLDPPAWREPPAFFYHCELAQRLAGWHQDYGQTASAMRTLAVHHAYLDGRTETDETDWSLLARVASDMVPPWVARAVEYLSAAPDHQAETRTLAREMRLTPGYHQELARLYAAGLFTLNETRRIWGLVHKHAQAVAQLVAGRAFRPAASAAR